MNYKTGVHVSFRPIFIFLVEVCGLLGHGALLYCILQFCLSQSKADHTRAKWMSLNSSEVFHTLKQIILEPNG
ncbi:hypothetical protein Q8A67_021159 [Cirrhinus molitorella]|uniref:Uncharacterized protein n=1 Tax=Cirrhinus molitorella TaxID=172907 RepID=A0AA88PH05_9TELE|nr:hypothetical protein Q8A67_021159 [Cirrhinus molitorella]